MVTISWLLLACPLMKAGVPHHRCSVVTNCKILVVSLGSSLSDCLMQLAKYIYCGDQEGLALDLQYSHYVMENGQRGVYFTVNILICLFPGLPYFQFKAPPIVSHPLCFCLHQYSASHKTHVQGTTLSTFDPPNKWPTY